MRDIVRETTHLDTIAILHGEIWSILHSVSSPTSSSLWKWLMNFFHLPRTSSLGGPSSSDTFFVVWSLWLWGFELNVRWFFFFFFFLGREEEFNVMKFHNCCYPKLLLRVVEKTLNIEKWSKIENYDYYQKESIQRFDMLIFSINN